MDENEVLEQQEEAREATEQAQQDAEDDRREREEEREKEEAFNQAEVEQQAKKKKKKKAPAILGVLFFPFKWVFKQIQKITDSIAFQMQPKDVRQEMIREAYAQAKVEQEKEAIESHKENPKTTQLKMEIVRDGSLKQEEKLKELCQLCHDSGRSFEVATNQGGMRFEKEQNCVSIYYVDKTYRTAEEKEQGIARYPFGQHCLGAVFFDKKGRPEEYEKGILDVITKMNNQKDDFDPTKRNLTGIMETERAPIAEKDTKEVTMTKTEEEAARLNKAIANGDKETIQEFTQKAGEEATQNTVAEDKVIENVIAAANNLDYENNSVLDFEDEENEYLPSPEDLEKGQWDNQIPPPKIPTIEIPSGAVPIVITHEVIQEEDEITKLIANAEAQKAAEATQPELNQPIKEEEMSL